jgi:hypothetical protein
MSRATLNAVALSETALESLSAGTSSLTNACRTGASNADTMPRAPAKTNTIQSSTTPVRVRMPSPSPSAAIVIWVMNRMVRRLKRSATSPVSGTSSSCGAKLSAIVNPTAVASSSVSWVSTSQSWAMRCIHAPVLETSAPPNHSR